MLWLSVEEDVVMVGGSARSWTEDVRVGFVRVEGAAILWAGLVGFLVGWVGGCWIGGGSGTCVLM